MKKLYFLGPKGTYSEKAAKKFLSFLNDVYETCPISTIAKVIELVNSNEKSIGVVPIENSIEGIVRPAIDNIYSSDVLIQAQIEIKINHCLISKGNLDNIKYIVSHPQALAQCQKFIVDNFGDDIELVNSSSTAQALNFLKDKSGSYAAIASEDAVLDNEFKIVSKNISDVKDNKTRFVLISKHEINLGKKERTSIVFNTKNEPGALFRILEIIKKHDLNLVYIESRPSKKVFGEYNFFVDVDKGLSEIQEAISEIQHECNYYKLLGSYSIL